MRSRTPSSSSCSTGLGALRDLDATMRCCGFRPWSTPGARSWIQRPGELHPGQPVHPRRGPGVRELLRRRGIQLGRHRLGRQGRARRWPSGSSTVHHRPHGRRHPPLAPSTATWPGCTTGWPRYSACTTRSPGPTANSPPPGRSAAPRCTTCWWPPTPTSAAGWAGAITFRATRHRAGDRGTPGASRTGWTGRRPNSSTPAQASRCSTRRRSRVPARRAGCRTGAAVAVHRGCGCAGGRVGVHRHAQRTRNLRSDVTVTRTEIYRFLIVQQRGHHRTGQRDPSPGTCRPARGRTGRDDDVGVAVFGVMGPLP